MLIQEAKTTILEILVLMLEKAIIQRKAVKLKLRIRLLHLYLQEQKAKSQVVQQGRAALNHRIRVHRPNLELPAVVQIQRKPRAMEAPIAISGDLIESVEYI